MTKVMARDIGMFFDDVTAEKEDDDKDETDIASVLSDATALGSLVNLNANITSNTMTHFNTLEMVVAEIQPKQNQTSINDF